MKIFENDNNELVDASGAVIVERIYEPEFAEWALALRASGATCVESLDGRECGVDEFIRIERDLLAKRLRDRLTDN